MKTLLMAIVVMTTSGCMGSFCREHKVVCTVGGALVIGSVAATVAANSNHHTMETCAPLLGTAEHKHATCTQ